MILNDILSVASFVLQMDLLQNFYETTLEALKEAKNDRLWFKTNTKLGKLYFDRGEFARLQKILKQLHQSCQVQIMLFEEIHVVTISEFILAHIDNQ